MLKMSHIGLAFFAHDKANYRENSSFFLIRAFFMLLFKL
jgi:hypothetical protein